MRLPKNKRILREDVKGAPSWVNPMIDILNSFMETVYQAMNKNVTFLENIECQIKEITYKTPSTYPTGVSDVEFMSELKVKATSLLLMQAFERVAYVPPPGPVYIPWTESSGTIKLGTITGLEADKTYTIRLLLS